MAAIDYVRYQHDLSRASQPSVKELADLFIIEKYANSKTIYGHRSLEEVLNQLAFDGEQIAEARKCLHDISNVGMVGESAFIIDQNSSQHQYIDSITGAAIDSYNQYGIYPSITIAQAILESGWGQSELSVQANNFFGIKADPGWQGACVNMDTLEHYNSHTTASFRKYSSFNDSITDHGAFLHSNRRYLQNGVFSSAYYGEQAEALEKAGYSTKKDEIGNLIYADQLIEIIRQYNLQLIDYEARNME